MDAELHSENMLNILSRLPVKSLARCRCVSKQWCNQINDSYLETMHAKRAADFNLFDPVPIMFHQFPSDRLNSPCKISFLEYKEEEAVICPVKKKPLVMQLMCKSWSYRYPDDIVLGSCNGLLYSSKAHRDGNTLLFVIHPLRKERYDLPPIKTPFHPQQQQSWGIDLDESNRLRFEESSGHGFDDSTNSFKMVCIVWREQVENFNPMKNEDIWTMVHVLGTNSWRKIPQIPSFPISSEGVFANRCLHWLISNEYDDYRDAYLGRPVVTFDMAKEEFGLINPPQELPSGSVKEQLVDLHGEVGYVYHIVNRRIELWVLKERGWVMHCEFQQKPPLPSGLVKVLGFLNNNEDILLTDNWKKQMFVYKLKCGSLHEVSYVDCREEGLIRMYHSSLFTTRYSIKNLAENKLAN